MDRLTEEEFRNLESLRYGHLSYDDLINNWDHERELTVNEVQMNVSYLGLKKFHDQEVARYKSIIENSTKTMSTQEPVVEAITPDEVLKNRPKYIHPDIIRIVNEILSQKFIGIGSEVSIKRKTIEIAFLSRNPDFERSKLYDDKHMDFEDVFRKAGWKVSYHSPCRDESFEEHYNFSMKK